jgi:DNA-binding CsgD family transcriptional regulator/tetratricopeptide (TPR) repeat protein
MSSAGRDAGAVASPWPVVGRAEEIELVTQALGRRRAGSVIVLGAPGVGKTSLLRETAHQLRSRSQVTRWIVGIPSAAMPFGALAPFLPPDLDDAEPAMLVSQAVRTLAAATAGGRPLVVVDDANLLDQASALVVSQLLHADDVDVICAWRSGEEAPGLEWALRDQRSTVVELQPLSVDDVTELLDAVLGAPMSPAATDALYQHSQGGALFLRELVEDALAAGALNRAEDGWALSPSWRPGHRVMELVTRRIGRRPEAEQVVLEALAVAEPVALDVLAALSDPEALVALERARLIEVRSDGLRADVRFAHPLYGEAVRSRLGRAAARQRTRALADALAATGLRRRGDVLTLARWRLEGGGGLDAEQWATAARQAIALEAPDAELITRRAVEAGAGSDAWTALGQLRTAARDLAGAVAAFEQAAAAATTDDQRAQAGIGQARALFWVADRADEALAQLDGLLEQVDDEDARRALVVQRISVLVNAGRFVEGLAAIDELLAIEDLPAEHRIDALHVRTIALAFAGHTDEAGRAAAALLEEGLALASQHPELLPTAAVPSLVVGLVAGELRASRDLVELFRPQASGPEAVGYVAALEGRLALMRGRVRTAVELLEEARRNLALTMARSRSAWVDALLDEAGTAIGERPDLAAAPDPDPGGDLAHRFLVVDAIRARAVSLAQTGDARAAAQLLEHGLAVSREAGMLATEVWLGYERFRLDPSFAEPLAALTGRMNGPVGTLFPRHARAHLLGDADELEATALALADADFTLYAARCAADASRVFRKVGQPHGASRCAGLARRLLDQCEGACTDLLVDLTAVDALTAREREVTVLAARGLSNREIADVTCTSVRTVEGHLLRSFRKLGINNRSELASYLRSG